MTTTNFIELLGEELVQHNESESPITRGATNQLNGKTVALYFSAHWCPPCRRFTPKLAEIFKQLDKEVREKLDIVFVSWDEDEDSFNEYLKEMPWKALPFSDRDRSKTLSEKYTVQGIPTLVVLSPSGEIITPDGVEEVHVEHAKPLYQWIQGKKLFWSRPPEEGEFVWEDAMCKQCYMKPLVGSRHGCTKQECDIDLCKTCLPNYKHDHQLVEYLTPNKHYSMQQLLQSVPYLLSSDSDKKIETKELWGDNVKSIGFYFSAHWCPPCRGFTPQLASIYKEAQEKCPGCRIIFISCDRDIESFNSYRAEMPWPAVPFDAGAVIKVYFQFSDGQVLSRQGRGDIGNNGVEALKIWGQGQKLPRPPPEKYQWSSVNCDGCGMSPLIGQRYYCETCGNYDLCSACEKKGHDHALQLIPQPGEDDENR